MTAKRNTNHDAPPRDANLHGAIRGVDDPPIPGYVGVPIPGTKTVRLQREPPKLDPARCNVPCPECHDGHAAGSVLCGWTANHGGFAHLGTDERGAKVAWTEKHTTVQAERLTSRQLAEGHTASILGRALALRLLAHGEALDEQLRATLMALLLGPEPSHG